MTKRLYYTDSSLTEFSATVMSITPAEGSYEVVLSKSAFYPTSGGQYHDTGNLDGIEIVDVIERDDTIVHVLSGKPGFGTGDTVRGSIDRQRRHDNMQKHTGQHILSRAFINLFGAETVSSRLGEDDSTIDLNKVVASDQIVEAESNANGIVYENRPVTVSFVPYEKLAEIPLRKIPDRGSGDFRIVTIADYDWSACGGTHCRATGEVGIIKITGREKVRDTTRLHFLTGRMALEDYRWRFDQIEGISNLFTRHARESLAAVSALLEESTALRKKTQELNRELFPVRIGELYAAAPDIAGKKVVAMRWENADIKEAKEFALAVTNARPAVAIIGIDDKLLVSVTPGLDVRASDLIKAAGIKYGGRGGGSDNFAQGGKFRGEDVTALIADPRPLFDL